MEETFELWNKPTGRNSDLARAEMKPLLIHHYICSCNDIIDVMKWFPHALKYV